ncbi:MAG: TetR family transcriptional regulator [Terriglobia bacterium]
MAAMLARRAAPGNKLDHILVCATRVFYQKGYAGASIRDIARCSRVSLAGIYYYVESKEELLYLIQKQCFATLLARLEAQLDGTRRDPEAKLRLLVRNHLEYFLQNREAMKVLSHESDSLGPPYAAEVAEIKRAYYRVCRGIVEELKRARQLKRLPTRMAVLSLFGMMNWIYTWYNPRLDPNADTLAEQMAGLFLRGVRSGSDTNPAAGRSRNGRGRPRAD